MRILNATKIVPGLALAAVLLPLAVPAEAQSGYRVIVNSSNSVSSLSEKEVADFFLKRSTKWADGGKVTAVDLASSSSVRRSFTDTVHGKSVAAIKSYWQKMIFSGRATPPRELSSDRDVLDYVRSNSNAIGYVSDGTEPGRGVKALRVTDS